MKIAGIAGNRGRNLLHIADIAPGGAELSVVVANGEDAPVLDGAQERDIPNVAVERGPDESRESHEERILDVLAEHEFDLVCLDGFMRILSPEFLDSVNTVLNVHPSLLPAFPGADAHGQVIDADVRTAGATVHVATEALDEGPIVTQESVPVFEDDDEGSLKERVLYEAEFEAYPRAIRWFAEGKVEIQRNEQGDPVDVDIASDTKGDLPTRRTVSNRREDTLRYGENPHQDAAVYASDASEEPSVVHAAQRNEGAKDLSYNNYNDADAALSLVKEFEAPAAAVIKHTNPAGCATADSLAEAYRDALSTDAKSAFGGIVALNRECDAETAAAVADSFKEVVVAPGYTDDALDALTEKENLRVLDVGNRAENGRLGPEDRTERFSEKALVGGRLVQERDRSTLTRDDLEVVTEREPTDEQIETMLFAWKTLKHVKSNGILIADGTETVGVGMGQVSRVDAVTLAAMKAENDAEGKSAEGAVVASDAFFPFPDAVEEAAEAGVEAVIQPGGSVNDDDVIEAANELGLAMVFTGQRAFRHD
ncbi:bifunctional phosphoribosylaminoimidazolecarboxamide formyltransferase/IMP cyclohydrolase [Halolamina sp. CBA1230]|uniref:bifunctional phosphoribosylaminoimidazolecarboxamide formyltransferase/IMP cyclohydrolase n=1 Tax=Halolamina sp. CBA1230 TaxID=1853690 RepID=UPI0009A15DE4|nr:bifunctional phosphoribosylaminoimidazolecarboxamide formyltransferase/IMP cyclohydrolase [Halolamina sp. CBA1230]QKY18943.1 bifunctional phosphoribosylaminoimidazolecarboxamide formyltransferase/IMP cyclohydrolase [Halolamina sp. CBA1230]